MALAIGEKRMRAKRKRLREQSVERGRRFRAKLSSTQLYLRGQAILAAWAALPLETKLLCTSGMPPSVELPAMHMPAPIAVTSLENTTSNLVLEVLPSTILSPV